jgi:putative addiction module component (TIGR02574 family)
MEPTQVFHAALSLPEEQRADLASRLLDSLTPATGLSEDAPDFEDELERRVRAYESGKSSASDWDAVSARLHAALESREES